MWGSLETATLTVHGQRQWALVHHHDFEADGHGWADAATGAFIELSEGGYLGGHCKTLMVGCVSSSSDATRDTISLSTGRTAAAGLAPECAAKRA